MGYSIDIQFFNTFIIRSANSALHFEESRIKGGFNEPFVSIGPKAHIVDENFAGQRRGNALIYSGVYNSRTDINRTNVFSSAEPITRAVDPANGDINRLHAEDTNLNILQENKVSYALIDKDYNIMMGFLVIGVIIRLVGNLISDLTYALIDPRIRFK